MKRKKEIRISDRMYEYYENEEIKVASENYGEVDEKCLSEIIRIAKDDIKNNRSYK